MVKQMSGKSANATASPKPHPTWRKRFQQNMKILNESNCRSCLRQSYVALLHQKQHLRAMKQPGAGRKKSADVSPLVVIAPKTGRIGKKAQDAAADAEKTTEKKRKGEAAYLKPPPASKRPKKPAGQDPTGARAEDEATTLRKSDTSRSRADKLASSTGGPSKSRKEPPKLGASTAGGATSQPGTPKSTPSATPTGSISKLWPARLKTPRVNGLWNPEVYCYRNTAVQTLVCIPQFLNILNTHHPRKCNKICVLCAVRDLANAYHTSEGWKSLEKYRRALDASVWSCRNQIPKWQAVDNKRHDEHQQQDLHEFIVWLIAHVQNSGISKNAFDSIYSSQQQHSWTCHVCNATSVSSASEPTKVLTLQLIGKTLAACMDDTFGDADVQIRCEKCKSNEQRIRTTRILTAPDVLYLHFNRFGGHRTPNGFSATKTMDLVKIPQTLDLSRWTVQSKKNENLVYRLKAVALHGGSTTRKGHYTAVIRHGDTWHNINDHHTTLIDPKDVAAQVNGSYDNTPYILTYVKADSDE